MLFSLIIYGFPVTIRIRIRLKISIHFPVTVKVTVNWRRFSVITQFQL